MNIIDSWFSVILESTGSFEIVVEMSVVNNMLEVILVVDVVVLGEL